MVRPDQKRAHAMLQQIPNLATEVFLTWGHPNPSGELAERRGHSNGSRTPMDLIAWDTLRPDEHGLLFKLTMCVRLIAEELRDSGERWPALANPPTWAGECGWLISTERWWSEQPWHDDIEHDVREVWAELTRATRTPPPLRLVCPRCSWPVHQKANGAYYECEAGHIIDHFAEVKRMGQIQEMTSAELTEHMGVTDRTLRRWRDAGAVSPCGKRGREPLYSVLDVQKAREMFGR